MFPLHPSHDLSFLNNADSGNTRGTHDQYHHHQFIIQGEEQKLQQPYCPDFLAFQPKVYPAAAATTSSTRRRGRPPQKTHQPTEYNTRSSIIINNNISSSSIGTKDVGQENIGDPSFVEEEKRKNKNKNKNKNKQIVHREIERQRRQEMASLHASLRDLLPIEYIKGKRSVSDHINEAARYIGDMDKSLQQLEAKKEELQGRKAAVNSSSHRVTVSPCCEGVVINIVICKDSSIEELGVFPLSKALLEVLLQEGYSAFSWASAKEDDRLLLTIMSEVGDPVTVDQDGLQLKLMEAIHSL